MTDAGAYVLVVDDEPQILRGLKVVLTDAGVGYRLAPEP